MPLVFGVVWCVFVALFPASLLQAEGAPAERLAAGAAAVGAVAAEQGAQDARVDAEPGQTDPAQSPQLLHAISMHGEPRYPADFKHFSHVNPDAPKGGDLKLALLGSFDSLNPLIIKGVSAAGLRGFVYESLLSRGLDEPFTLYSGLAKFVEMPKDRTSITFHIDARAAFSDGHPVDADDILFSWEILRDRGRPNHRTYYSKVADAVRVSDKTIRFELGPGTDRELPLILGLMPILPAHVLTPETFDQTTLTPPVGTGPYLITKVEPGRSVTYTRDANYWGRDLAVNRGRFNFETIRYDYFRDASAMFEAFKLGRIDLRLEEAPAQWAEGYDIPAVRNGQLLKREIPIGLPAGMTGFAMNARRAPFDDIRVREAMVELFDFNWVNKNLFHGLYTRSQSYFARSDLASYGRPADPREASLLTPFASLVDPAILKGTYALPKTAGDGRNRKAWRRALQLLSQAGYKLDNGVLRQGKTGKALAFEMLAASPEQQRLFLAFARDLKRLGIQANVRIVDSSQYQSRLSTYDYDMIQARWPSSLSPGNEQLFRWSSKMADREGTFNFAGVKNPAVDAMIMAMLAAEELEDFRSAVRALDRVLLSGYYVIPLFHLEKQWVAHWARLKAPDVTPLFGYQLDAWWAAEAQAAN
ncbi:MAG: extracellular solute-binding protein [Pseudomonadota bacterium]